MKRYSVSTAFALMAMASSAAAQCPMCSASLAGDPKAKAASHQMDIAILLLLIPAILIFTGFFVLIYKYRNHFNSPAEDLMAGLRDIDSSY
jgi:hypothetical protein